MYDLIGLCYWQSLPGVEQEKVQHGQAQWLHSSQRLFSNGQPVPGLPPCTDGIGPYTFLNNPTVQAAIHVNSSVEWLMCVGGSNWTYTRSPKGSYYLYPNLIRKGYRIWIYSGDTDGAVPTTGTLFWVNQLSEQYALSTLVPWRAWYQPPNAADPNPNNRQNAGQVWQIQGLTLVTFKGVGHMVPQQNRIGALEMIRNFMNNQEMPAQ